MTFAVNRRQALAISVGGVATVLGWANRAALATPSEAAAVVADFTAGKTPAEGRVNLDLPDIADDGNSVPMTITVDSPMTEEDHVTDVLVVADGNPRPGVAVFHFSPASGVAEVSTRIRMAQSEHIIAVAKMNDGSVFMARKQVTVTVGGCGTA